MNLTDYGIYKLSQEDHNHILLSLIDSLQIGSSRNDSPCILIISGQPGCGKTLLSDVLRQDLFLRPNDVAVINGDDYRQDHPMSEFSSVMARGTQNLQILTQGFGHQNY